MFKTVISTSILNTMLNCLRIFMYFYFYVDSSDYITHFHCLFDYLRWALAQRTWHHDCIELMYSFLLEWQRFKFHLLMQWQTVLSDSSFPKYSSTHVAIFNTAVWHILMQCHLRAQRSCTFTWGFLSCPTQTEILQDPMNLFTMLCMVVGERPIFF